MKSLICKYDSVSSKSDLNYDLCNTNTNTNTNIDILKLSKTKRISLFNKQFMKLRESLELKKVSRKCQFDSLLKKVKAKFFKTIFIALKKCLVDSNQIRRLPQSFVTNIKIDFNKDCLERSLISIYNKFGMFTDLDMIIEKQIIKKDKKDDFISLLKMQLKDLFDIYLNSEQFINEKEKMADREGRKLSELFEFIARNIVKYYLTSKGNKSKKCKMNIEGNTKNINGGIKSIFKVISNSDDSDSNAIYKDDTPEKEFI
jgi:hypothetical protein